MLRYDGSSTSSVGLILNVLRKKKNYCQEFRRDRHKIDSHGNYSSNSEKEKYVIYPCNAGVSSNTISDK